METVFDNRVAFERVAGRTVLKHARATSPLRLLTPKNHGVGAWVFSASLGGGLVDGDAIALHVEVGPGALGLLGTQASTKVYRCPTATCRQDIVARISPDALLVSIPDPVACFAGARYEQSTIVEMSASSSLLYVDAFTAGRSARGERWDFLGYRARSRVIRDGRPVLTDAIVLDPAQGALRSRMGRFDAFATIVVMGPALAAIREAALLLPETERGALLVMSASPLGDDGAIVRIAGASVEAVTAAVRARLAGLRGVLGDDPFARKW